MKSRVVITAEELKDAALYLLSTKTQFFGKHVSTVEFVFDATDNNPSRQIRCEVVLFDTADGAKRYLATREEIEGTTAGPAATTGESDAADLEGERSNG
jgi:hypothetical protein